ncbi:MAG: hypothetical protein VB078_02515 [Clostridiaceae bacterium]|nr:hypothetical protein [Clostridiaceae bacterium]
MEQDSTSMLMNVLKSANKEDISKYQTDHLFVGRTGFCAYMDALILEKRLKRRGIFQKADIPQKYGYKLLSGESHTSNRDKLLRIFIAMNMTLKEIQRALALYDMPVLYPKRKRDAIIIIAINKGVSSVDIVNEWLVEQGETELSRIED